MTTTVTTGIISATLNADGYNVDFSQTRDGHTLELGSGTWDDEAGRFETVDASIDDETARSLAEELSYAL